MLGEERSTIIEVILRGQLYISWLTNLVLLGQRFNIIAWVGAHRLETDHGYSDGRLLPHFLHVQNHTLSILHTHGL